MAETDKNVNVLMRELVDKLNYYGYCYYVLDDSVVSDSEYDALYDSLVLLEKETGVVMPDSPTVRIGGEPVKEFGTHNHISKLYSLDKCKATEDLIAWADKITKTNKTGFTVEHKLDGLTICVTYDNGQFVRATTRGNGVTGEDVTAQVKTIRSVPLSIKYKGLTEVQGEAVMRLSVFNKYNEKAQVPLKNARNGVAGAIRNLDPKITAERKPDIYFYNINYIDSLLGSQTEMFEFIKDNGFLTSEYFVSDNINEIVNYIKNIDRQAVDYLIDGMVVKINDLNVRDRLGFTDKFPRWAIAYKFEAEETTTVVESVQWNVGRTGKVTPLAILRPVELVGATISRATLNNIGDIKRKNVRSGGRVFIRRSNDVIPEITGAADSAGEEIRLPGACPEQGVPGVCPECGSVLEIQGAHYFCTNTINCRAQIIGALEHFASKDCMDIEGLSEKTCELLFENGLINKVTDLYILRAEKLKVLEGFKDRRADNLIKAIEKSRGATLANFINALGIPNIGKKTAGDLSAAFGDINSLRGADIGRLTAINEVGGIMAASLIEFFRINSGLIDEFIGLGINPRHIKKTGILGGKKFVITGTLPDMKRNDAAKLIEDNGGIIGSGVTKDTDYLLAGEDAGSKLDKAKALGIKIISQQELIELIEK